MPWRNWSVIIILILANYVVFGLIAALVFPVQPQKPATHIAQPTFTPGALPMQRVGTLTYNFLTPSPSPTLTRRTTAVPTSTATISDTQTVTATAASMTMNSAMSAITTAVPTLAPASTWTPTRRP